MGMIDYEYNIISKAICGEHPVFRPLRKQLKSLEVVERKREPDRYLVEFKMNALELLVDDDSESAIKISDICFHIHESGELLRANITVLDGYIRWMSTVGGYDFRKPFTIKDVFWCKYHIGPSVDKEFVYEASQRDYEMAIGYIPGYM